MMLFCYHSKTDGHIFVFLQGKRKGKREGEEGMGREGLANAAGEIVRGQITVRGRWSTDHRVPSGRPRKSRRKKVRRV